MTSIINVAAAEDKLVSGDEEVGTCGQDSSLRHGLAPDRSRRRATDSDIPTLAALGHNQESFLSTFTRGVTAVRQRKTRNKQDSPGTGPPKRAALRRSLSKRISYAQRNQIEQENYSTSRVKWWHGVFFFSGISVIACLCQLFLPYPYGAFMTSAEIAEVGVAPGCEDGLERCICPRETICATNTTSMVLLALARSLAFFDYPVFMMMFLTKCHNINNVFRRTIFREWIDFSDMHKVHKIFGVIVIVESTFHTFFHLLRWGINSDIRLLWTSAPGISGMVAMTCIVLICIPMAVPAIKDRLAYEIRKGLHYLFIVWAIALMFHKPSMRYYLLIGIPALVYLVDFIFGYFARNSLIENAFFERYGEKGIALYFQNPIQWEERPKTSYVYVMCPWISKYQWHAFTIFPEPSKKNHTMLCIENTGDWTKELHRKVKVPCIRPLYVLGPYKSPFSDRAVTTSNAIAVASGIGITPTLSLVLHCVGKKRINIVWVCRDPGLIEYVLHKFSQDIAAVTKKSYVFIFYTGSRELVLPNLPANIFIFKKRPHLEHIITGIVTAIHSGDGLPEEMYAAQEQLANTPFEEKIKIAMNRVLEIYDENEMFEYAVEETEKAAALSSDQSVKSDGTLETASLEDSEGETTPLKSNRNEVQVPEGEVSLKGLESMISKFLGGIGEYSRDDIVTFFHEIDADGSGYIDRDEFQDFISMISADNMKKSQSQQDLLGAMEKSLLAQQSVSSAGNATRDHFGDDTTNKYVSNLRLLQQQSVHGSGDNPLEQWSTFYCGGSMKIKEILKEVTDKYGIALAIESFDY